MVGMHEIWKEETIYLHNKLLSSHHYYPTSRIRRLYHNLTLLISLILLLSILSYSSALIFPAKCCLVYIVCIYAVLFSHLPHFINTPPFFQTNSLQLMPSHKWKIRYHLLCKASTLSLFSSLTSLDKKFKLPWDLTLQHHHHLFFQKKVRNTCNIPFLSSFLLGIFWRIQFFLYCKVDFFHPRAFHILHIFFKREKKS